MPCSDGYVYDDSVFAHSLTSDFDAAPCADEEGLFTKVQLPETLFWLGMMLGNTVFGWTADLGRYSVMSRDIIALLLLEFALLWHSWNFLES